MSRNDETLLRDLFHNLSQQGLVAKPKHLCCRNCAHADLEQNTSYLFWTQEEDDIVRGKVGDLSLSLGGTSPEEISKVQEQVVISLSNQGFLVDCPNTSTLLVREVFFPDIARCPQCQEHLEECLCCSECGGLSYACGC